jgi:peptidoglycan/LPS O-acetylase OafA/YrhL
MVVANHAFPSQLAGGYAGVDVFFVISGYVITRGIAGEAASGALSVSQFYFRRIRRIFPALLTVLFSCFAFAWFCLDPNQTAQLGKQAASGALFVPNLMFLLETGYFDPAAETKPLLHLWSLGVEEQFYLFWPLALVLMRRAARKPIHVTAALLAASLALFVYVGSYSKDAAFYLPFTRFWEILAGCALALKGENPHIPRLGLDALSFAGLVLLAFAAIVSLRSGWLPSAWPLLPVSGSCALIFAGPQAAANRFLSHRPFVLLGAVSYPLYLWHWPVLSFNHVINPESAAWLTRLACVALSLALAFLTYRFVEAPIRFPPGRNPAAAAALPGRLLRLMSLAALAGAALFAADGARFRFPMEVRNVLAHADYEFMKDAQVPDCWLDGKAPFSDFAKVCFFRPEQAVDTGVLVWGDSHAARLYPGLRAVLGTKDGLAQLTRDSCPPLLGFGYQICQDSNELVLSYIKRAVPQKVILFAVWPHYARNDASRLSMENSLVLTIAALRAAGVKAVRVVGPFPIWDAPLPGILFRRWIFTKALPARLTPENAQKTAELDNALRLLALNSGAFYYSLVDLLCNTDGCMTSVPGRPGELLTWDYGHLTTAGALFVVGRFFDPAR